jgi:putative ABC transport system permease protein
MSGMSVIETFRVAIRALLLNKVRSFLTALGIIIGVAAVIAMVAMGEGAKANVERAFAAMGTNLLVILPGATAIAGASGGSGTAPTLSWEDLHAIQTQVRSVRYAVPLLKVNQRLVSDQQNWMTSVQGTTPAYLYIRNWRVVRGQSFTKEDVDAGRNVVLLGQTVVESLFGEYANPVGQTIRIRNVPFVVAGVLEPKGQSTTGQDYDDVALIPVSTYQTRIQGGLAKFINGIIVVSAISKTAAITAEIDLVELLKERHHIQPGAEHDFSVRNLSEVVDAQEEGTESMSALLAGIAAVSLLVGGIGIMNIMLVSVTERTKEIGLRMAIGARPRDVLLQFLVEALTLATTGGIIGIACGIIAAYRVAAHFHWPVLLREDVIAASVIVSGLFGVVFGLYPASRASRLDPIEALRYE